MASFNHRTGDRGVFEARLAPSFVLVRGLPRSRVLFSQPYQAKVRSNRRKLSEVPEFSRMNGISTRLASM